MIIFLFLIYYIKTLKTKNLLKTLFHKVIEILKKIFDYSKVKKRIGVQPR